MECVSLPDSIPAWRDVLQRAVSLDRHSIMLSSHLAMVDVATGQFSVGVFGVPPAASQRGDSAVMIALMPAVGGGETRPRGGEGMPFDATGQRDHELEAAPMRYTGLDLSFPVTIRAAKMRTHAGQAAFPGGRMEPSEAVDEAAIRETKEETDVTVHRGDVVGRLTRLYSFPAKSFVHPVVALLNTPQQAVRASVDEVEAVHGMTLGSLLLDWRFHHRITRQWLASVRMPAFYTDGGSCVWGLTAFAIVELVARVSTVLAVRCCPPERVLRAWGDADLVLACPTVPYANPYDDHTRTTNAAAPSPPSSSKL